MQGETLASVLCTNTMDTISKDCKIDPYKYRDSVDIPKLGFVDDLVDINTCVDKTKAKNDYTNEEINKRKLQCGPDKCSRMHFGRKQSCEELFIENWEVEKIKKKIHTLNSKIYI